MENKKRVLEIEGYSIEPARAGCHSIMVLSNDGTVVSFEDLNCAEYPVLLRAFESDAAIEKIVVADSKGAFIIGETDLIRL
jgi:hypothetical protein